MLSVFTILAVLLLVGSSNVMAGESADQTIEVQGDAIQIQMQSNVRTMFRFQERTGLTVCANIGLELDINCEALRIGDKDVIIEVEGDNDLKMTMTCKREENQLGLMNGSPIRVRNRNSYRYLEGICIAMEVPTNCMYECKCNPECVCPCDCECKCECDPVCECKCECDPVCECECECECKCIQECKCDSECLYNGVFLKARLKIRETNQNRLSQWAYYDNENNEWVTVPTINQDGYLSAETSILSTWTLLVPVEMSSAIVNTIVIASISLLGILAISGFYLKKRR